MKNKKICSILVCIMMLTTFSSTVLASQTYYYDANGNMIQDTTTNKCYGYNDANQMKNVTDCATKQKIAEYWYDSAGRRIKSVVNGVTTYYPTEDFEMNVSGTKADNATYFYANGERVARKDAQGVHYYHGDHLGSTSVVSGQSGAEEERVEYLPYGKVLSGGKTTKYLYTGKELGAETGLYYYGARYYNPNMTRFIQPDKIIQDIFDPQTLNHYAYVRNNPLKYIDPTGNTNLEGMAAGAFTALAGASLMVGGVALCVGSGGTIPIAVGALMFASGFVTSTAGGSMSLVSWGAHDEKGVEIDRALTVISRPLVQVFVMPAAQLLGYSKEETFKIAENLNSVLDVASALSGKTLVEKAREFNKFVTENYLLEYLDPKYKDSLTPKPLDVSVTIEERTQVGDTNYYPFNAVRIMPYSSSFEKDTNKKSKEFSDTSGDWKGKPIYGPYSDSYKR
jgi:RHS repeat-associated protein